MLALTERACGACGSAATNPMWYCFTASEQHVSLLLTQHHSLSVALQWHSLAHTLILAWCSVLTCAGITTSNRCAKLTRTVAFITRMIGSTILPLTVKALVNATVRAQISYGLPYWQPTSKQFAALNSLLAAPLKRALSLPRSAHTLSVLAEFGIPAVEVMREHLLPRAAARAVNLVPAGSDAAVWSKQAAALTFFDTVLQHT